MFENKTYEGIHYSRFVASYVKEGGSLERKKQYIFEEWLNQLKINDKPIPKDIVQDIYNYGTNGKMELEFNAYAFLKKQK